MSKPEIKHTNPADGERRAMVGYMPQYELAAITLLQHLRDGSLDFLRLGDTTAGRVDDFVIGSTNRIDGYSIKWSQYRGTYTFKSLVKNNGKNPSLINQLADGWNKLTTKYTNRYCTVHLLTSDFPSRNDACIEADEVQDKHFAAFLDQEWEPVHCGTSAVSQKWLQAWKSLQDSSGLNEDDFYLFVKSCDLAFGKNLVSDQQARNQDDSNYKKEVLDLASLLPKLVANPSKKIEYTRDELLKELGWIERYALRYSHDFPVREPYEPIKKTTADLLNRINSLESGYVILLGSPGAGKSTLLTRCLGEDVGTHRLVKYYAYVPGASDPRSLRGESTNFLHDIVQTIEKAGFLTGKSQGVFDRDILLSRLHDQLQLLSKDYENTGRKTVILIDGLDHIHREQRPNTTLVADLPHREQIPSGVIFVLGSQTPDLPGLPPNVHHTLLKNENQIHIESLSREACISIIERSCLAAPIDNDQKNKIVDLSAGHPLGLNLIINKIKTLNTVNDVNDALEKSTSLEDGIESYYYSLWSEIEPDSELVELLGHICRVKRGISWSWASTWIDKQKLISCNKKLGHLFRTVYGDVKYFFHNSFAQFLISQTRNFMQNAVPDGDAYFHHKLAEICSKSSTPYSWDRVHHLSECKQYSDLLELINWNTIHDQIAQFRPIEEIENDIRIAAHHAGTNNEIALFAKFVLMLAEMSNRSYHFSPWTVAELLLQLERGREAFEYIYDESEIRISDDAAMEAADLLHFHGLIDEARIIFDRAEPWNLIKTTESSDQFDPRDNWETVCKWASTAPLFRTPDEIIHLISSYEHRVRPHQVNKQEDDTQFRRSILLYEAAETARERCSESEYTALLASLSEIQDDSESLYVWIKIREIESKVTHRSAQQIGLEWDAFISSIDLDVCSKSQRLKIAEFYLRYLNSPDEAQAIIKNIELPTLDITSAYAEISFQDCIPYYLYFCITQALNGVLDLKTFFEPSDPRTEPNQRLCSALIQIGALFSLGWTGKPLSLEGIQHACHQFSDTLNPSFDQSKHWTAWYRVTALREELYSRFIRACQLHGPHAISTSEDFFHSEWNDSKHGNRWSVSLKRSISMDLFFAGGNRNQTISVLRNLKSRMLQHADVEEKIEQWKEQAEAMIALDDRTEATACLDGALKSSFGIGYRKDYQLDDWIKWIDQNLITDQSTADSSIPLFTALIVQAEESSEGPAAQSASIELLQRAVQINPRKAIHLWRFLEKHSCITHNDALVAICKQSLKLPSPPIDYIYTIYKEIILSITKSPDIDLLSDITKHCYQSKETSDATAMIDSLCKAIKTIAHPSSRFGLLSEIERIHPDNTGASSDFGSQSIPDRLRPKEREYDEHSIELQNGQKYSPSEFDDAIKSPKDLINVLEIGVNGYIAWERKIESALSKATREEVEQIQVLLKSKDRESLVLSRLSRRLTELGQIQQSWKLAEEALQESSRHGWVRFGDGGTRLEAVRAMIASDRSRGRQIGLRQLANDVAGGNVNIKFIAQEVHTLIALFDPNPPYSDIWIDVQEYLHGLGYSKSIYETIEHDWNHNYPDGDATQAMCDLLQHYLCGYVQVLSNGATSSLGYLIQHNDPTAIEVISELFDGDDKEQVSAINLIHAVATKDPESVKAFTPKLKLKIKSSNYYISMISKQILELIGEDELPERIAKPLPSVYKLAVPPDEDLEPAAASLSEPLPEATGPRDLLRPYDHQLGAMAAASALDEDALLWRAASIVQRLATTDELHPDAESAYRSLLHNAGLRFPFRRLRGAYSRLALGYVAAELIDGNRVADNDLLFIERLLWHFDAKMALIAPGERPSTVQRIEGIDAYESRISDWVNNLSNQSDKTIHYDDEWRVIAQTTVLKRLDRSGATETCDQTIVESGTPAGRNLFRKVQFLPAENYHLGPWIDNAGNSLIWKHVVWGTDTEGAEWIAINPKFCKWMGWVPSNKYLFAWEDESGQPMIRSYWWKDGSFYFSSPAVETEVGEGWLVLATDRAIESIRNSIGDIESVCRVERSARQGQPDGDLVNQIQFNISL